MPDVFIADKKEKKKDPAGLTGSGRQKVTKGRKKVKRFVKSKDRHRLPGHSHNPLSAYIYYPDRVKFVNEDPQEKIVLLVRRHPITNLGWIVIGFLMLTAPVAASTLPLFDSLPFRFIVVGVLIWYLVTLAFIFESFLSWFFHVNIITDERIIEVDFTHLLYREITDADIDNIEDVTVEMAGGVRTYFNFGNILIQTAAQVPRINFEAVPKPDKVARILRDLRIEEEQEKLEGRVR
jgi:hypothetical protein